MLKKAVFTELPKKIFLIAGILFTSVLLCMILIFSTSFLPHWVAFILPGVLGLLGRTMLEKGIASQTTTHKKKPHQTISKATPTPAPAQAKPVATSNPPRQLSAKKATSAPEVAELSKAEHFLKETIRLHSSELLKYAKNCYAKYGRGALLFHFTPIDLEFQCNDVVYIDLIKVQKEVQDVFGETQDALTIRSLVEIYNPSCEFICCIVVSLPNGESELRFARCY